MKKTSLKSLKHCLEATMFITLYNMNVLDNCTDNSAILIDTRVVYKYTYIWSVWYCWISCGVTKFKRVLQLVTINLLSKCYGNQRVTLYNTFMCKWRLLCNCGTRINVS